MVKNAYIYEWSLWADGAVPVEPGLQSAKARRVVFVAWWGHLVGRAPQPAGLRAVSFIFPDQSLPISLSLLHSARYLLSHGPRTRLNITY